jgi:hypothetical protein
VYRTQGEEREGSYGGTRLLCCGVQYGGHKVGVLEDTMISEMEARE